MYYRKPFVCFTNAVLRQCGKRPLSSFVRSGVAQRTSTIWNHQSPAHQRNLFRPQQQQFRLKSDEETHDSSSDEPKVDIKRSAEELQEMEENKKIEAEVKQWLDNVVVGLNLCPFAERPIREKNLRIFTIRGNDDEKLLSSILVVLLLQESTPGTSIIICPECYPDDFQAYMDVVSMIEEGLLEENDLTGVLQVAPFHPLFQFEGNDQDSIDNWTNRAPYPIFHVLREDEVERAADAMDGDASRVWKRNVVLLEALEEALGADGVQRVFTSKATAEEKERLDEILKQHRLVMRPKH